MATYVYSLIMMNILTKEFDYTYICYSGSNTTNTASVLGGFSYRAVVNKCCIFMNVSQVYLFSLVINNHISFIEIGNLTKNLFTSLNCQ